jgi:hypothetical protein
VVRVRREDIAGRRDEIDSSGKVRKLAHREGGRQSA